LHNYKRVPVRESNARCHISEEALDWGTGTRLAALLRTAFLVYTTDTTMAIFHTGSQESPGSRCSLTGTRWLFAAPPEGAAAPPELHPAVAQVLASRGIVTEEDRAVFIEANLAMLADPMLLPEMAAAVEAVLDALQRGASIRVFGDYDADGITATALLVRALGALSARKDAVDWYLPHRIDDGYGLNPQALDDAKADGVELGITVDNGITAHAQLEHAREIGLSMIVTDHHEPGEPLPPVVAVLNPKRADSVYPYRELAGVGVAFILLRAVCAARGFPPDTPMKFLDLVTLGTVADVAPLTGENRILVRHGLPMLTPQSRKVGLAALLRAVGIRDRASTYDVGFQLGPRLNAAGRMAHAETALKLLLTSDREEAESLAAQLCAHNEQRQEEEAHTLEQAQKMVEARDWEHEKVLVLDSAEWHPGIIGIVASRIVERYHRPCALIAVQDGVGKGSARARAPFHLWEALGECAHLLQRFGGHRVAAGFELDAANIPALREALLAVGERTLTAEDLCPSLTIDAWLDVNEVTTGFARQVKALEPFGMGNPSPVFAAGDVVVQHAARRGQDGSHLGLTLRTQMGERPLSAIWFRHGDLFDRLSPGARADVAFTVDLDVWQGITSAKLFVKDILA